jgi:hypothetical protein
MNCQRARESFPDLLDGRRQPTGSAERSEVDAARAHVASCPDCQRDFSSLTLTLAALDGLPDQPPGAELRRGFYAMLEEEKNSAASVRAAAERTRERRRHRWIGWLLAPLAAAALVAAGYLAGARSRAIPASAPAALPVAAVTADPETKREIQELRSKIERMESLNQLVATTFQRQQRPANERLATLLTTASSAAPDERIINELITSLALDASANVRLRALEALYPHAAQEAVRSAVLASLTRETNPVVQLGMIDFLAAAREHEARPALERLISSDVIDQNVRQAAKRALAQL